jgi:hypothetical protein
MAGADGVFSFLNRPAGMYKIKAEKDGYFSKETAPFRFNGTEDLRDIKVYLDRMPTKDLTLGGTVGTDPVPVIDEAVTFTYTPEPNHQVNSYWEENTTSFLYYIYIPDGNVPIVNDGTIRLWWNTTDKMQQEPADYEVIDYWNGIIWLKNTTINKWLDDNRDAGALRMKYNHSETTANFANNPVAYNSLEVRKNGSPWPSTGDYEVDYSEGTITVFGNYMFGVDSMTVNYTHYTPVMDAKLVLMNKTHDQVIEEIETTDSTFSFDLWAGPFELTCASLGYEKYADQNLVISASTNMTVMLGISEPVHGWVENDDPAEIRAYLVSYDTALPLSKRIVTATVEDTWFSFDAYPGNYLLIVDADGYKAHAEQITVPVPPPSLPLSILLEESPEELHTTDISFISNDWNNIVVKRNMVLNNDSRIFGMDYDDIRNAQLQIDLALGDKDGTLSSNEFDTLFKDWLIGMGPEYVTYENFMTINSRDYMSWYENSNPCDTEYYVDVKRVSETIYINTTTYYTTNFTNFTNGFIGQGVVDLDQQSYYLNITMKMDSSTDVYRNYTYMVRLPVDSNSNIYELNLFDSFIPDGVMVDGFIDVNIDPTDLATQTSAELLVERSLNGTARAKVLQPQGSFYVLNSSFDNYSAIVKSETLITFSAVDSTDPNQRTLDGANFTWYFDWPTDPTKKGYGMEPAYNYTSAGEYTVKLDLTEAGGNLTTTQITIKVDNTIPTAVISVDDHTLVTSGSYKILYVNQSKIIKLNGSASFDVIFGSEPGEIEEWRWFWEYLADNSNESQLGKIWELSFNNPGRYDVRLNVTDVVGHTSPTVNITAVVRDIEDPKPAFKKIENGTWRIRENLIENELYWFDASSTTDNYDEIQDLTFNWTFPGNKYRNGMNVSHTFADTGTFNVTLNVTDTSGNYAESTQSVIVSPNSSARPDLRVIDGSFVATPSGPEEGSTVTLSVNITNKKDRAVANNVVVNFTAIIDDEQIPIQGTVTFYDSGGTQISQSSVTINPNETVTAKISWVPSKMGNFTIKINATATNEHSGTMLDNTITAYVNVSEAGWKRILIYALIIIVPIIIFLLIYLRRKYKRGELFRGREEEEDERPRGRRRARGKAEAESKKQRRFFRRGKEEEED